jgi:hypothetical protein
MAKGSMASQMVRKRAVCLQVHQQTIEQHGQQSAQAFQASSW